MDDEKRRSYNIKDCHVVLHKTDAWLIQSSNEANGLSNLLVYAKLLPIDIIDFDLPEEILSTKTRAQLSLLSTDNLFNSGSFPNRSSSVITRNKKSVMKKCENQICCRTVTKSAETLRYADISCDVLTLVTESVIQFWRQQNYRWLKKGQIERKVVGAHHSLSTSGKTLFVHRGDLFIFSELWVAEKCTENGWPMSLHLYSFSNNIKSSTLFKSVDIMIPCLKVKVIVYTLVNEECALVSWCTCVSQKQDIFVKRVSLQYPSSDSCVWSFPAVELQSVHHVIGQPSTVAIHAPPLLLLYKNRNCSFTEVWSSRNAVDCVAVSSTLLWIHASGNQVQMLFDCDSHIQWISGSLIRRDWHAVRKLRFPLCCSLSSGVMLGNHMVASFHENFIMLWNLLEDQKETELVRVAKFNGQFYGSTEAIILQEKNVIKVLSIHMFQ